MKNAAAYAEKLHGMEGQTLLAELDGETRDFVRRVATDYRLTFQELRQVTQAARDLAMWREAHLESWWEEAEQAIAGSGRERKKALMARLEQHLAGLAAGEKAYPAAGLSGPPRLRVKLAERASSATVFGRCAAYSDKTVCCGLQTIDAVMGCSFACSYCTIQTFYGDTAELQEDLPAKLAAIDLDPERVYHIGTGQASDSLVWGNRAGILEALLDFAARHPNVLLELKTKSDNVRYLLDRDVPGNVVCSWSLSTDVLIRNEEHGTASLERRLAAAQAMAEHCGRVAFHFHPMVYYQGWREDYGAVAAALLSRFSPQQVAFLSMGSVTLIKPVAQEIRRRGGETKILQMEMDTDPHGKLTYPHSRKVELFRHLYEALQPWHDEVFMYLCMETDAVWQDVFGRSYPTNDAFEQDFARCCHLADDGKNTQKVPGEGAIGCYNSPQL